MWFHFCSALDAYSGSRQAAPSSKPLRRDPQRMVLGAEDQKAAMAEDAQRMRAYLDAEERG